MRMEDRRPRLSAMKPVAQSSSLCVRLTHLPYA